MSKLLVVMYHYVRNLNESRYPEIKGLDVKLFEEQLLYLKKNYNIISMEEVLEYYKTQKELPSKAVLLTFDDGYKDHYTYVLPVLMKLNIKGCFYIPTKSFKKKEVLDVNKIHFILASEKDKDKIIQEIFRELSKYRDEYNLESNEFYYNKLCKESRFDTGEVIFIKRLLQVELPEKVRYLITNNLFKKFVNVDEKAFWEELYLTKDQINMMKKCGMHIGSHGYDHYWLNSLTKEKQKSEIKKSLETLKEIGIDIENWTCCYPYGGYNEETIEILSEFGCKLGLTTEVRVANLDLDNKFKIPRLDTNDLPKDKSYLVNDDIWYEKI